MQGNQAVVDYMNELLSASWRHATNTLSTPASTRMGLHQTFERLNHEMEEETTHAEDFIRRILMLGGTPKMARAELNIGTDVVSCLKADLQTEYEVRDALKRHQTVRRGSRLCYARPDGCPTERYRRRPRPLAGTAASPDRVNWRRQLLPKPTVIRIRNKRSPYERRPSGLSAS